jgi:FkbM family methyltransferase
MNHNSPESSKNYQKKNRIAYLLSLPTALWTRKRLIKRRKLLDIAYLQLFEGVEGGSLRVWVKNFPGVFEFNVRSHILRRILQEKHYEPEIVNLIEKHLDSKKDAVDVGANVGLYTVLMSKLLNRGRKVLSIEPTPAALEYLHRNIVRSKSAKSVVIYEGIVTDRKGTFQLNVIPGMEEYSSLGTIVHESVQSENNKPISIKGDTIDHLVSRFRLSPGLLKIDTEGAEYQVLSGAHATLAKYRPTIIAEISDRMLRSTNANSDLVVNLLKRYGYNIASIMNPAEPVTFPYEGEIIAIHGTSLDLSSIVTRGKR